MAREFDSEGVEGQNKPHMYYNKAFLCLVAAFTVWLADNFACPILIVLPVYPQFHAFWHIFTGFAVYTLMLFSLMRHRWVEIRLGTPLLKSSSKQNLMKK